MTRLACLSAGMIFAINLRESGGLCDVGFVAARAQSSRIRKLRNHGRRIGRVVCERTVACLTIDTRVFARLLHATDIVVTVFTDLVPGILHRTRRDLGERLTTKVSILAETARHEFVPKSEKACESYDKNRGNPEEMSGVLEPVHWAIPLLLEFGRNQGRERY